MSLLECKGVTRIFDPGTAAIKALSDVSMSVEEGEFVAIVGRSGSGKSTLLNVLGMLDVPDEGEVLFNGTDVRKMSEKEKSALRNKSFGYVFQSFFLEPEYTVYENVEMPQYVTVTVNDDFVEHGDFESTVLKEGDSVEFLYFMGGGQ